MTEYRLAKPEEWEDCIELANYVFSTAHRPHDFEQLIPRVYQAGPEWHGSTASLLRKTADSGPRLRCFHSKWQQGVSCSAQDMWEAFPCIQRQGAKAT